MREIGAELGVAYLLEGSVRRIGSKVRVTGQLIDARTDEHVWAKSYDRDLTMFSRSSPSSLRRLPRRCRPRSRAGKGADRAPTDDNLAAYDLFLKAREVRNQGRLRRTPCRSRPRCSAVRSRSIPSLPWRGRS